MANFCPTCGVRVRPADKYCGICLVKLPGVESTPSENGAADSNPGSETRGEPAPAFVPEPGFAPLPLPLPEVPSTEPTREGIIAALRRCFGAPRRDRELDEWTRLLTFRSRDETLLVTAGLAPFGHELAVRVPEPVEALPDWAEALVIGLVHKLRRVRRGFTPGSQYESPVPLPGLTAVVLLEDPVCSPLEVGQARVPVFIACGLTHEEAHRWHYRILRKRLLRVLPTLATVASRPTSPALPAPELYVPPWTTPVTRAWLRIEHWLEERCGGASELLESPVTEEAITTLESRRGIRLPEAIRESWRRHDGEGHIIGLMSPWRLLPLAEMRSEWAEPDMSATQPEDLEYELGSWLTLADHDEDEGEICIPLGNSGRSGPGGVYRLDPESGERTRVARDWAEFLDDFANRLEAGELEFDPRGLMRLAGTGDELDEESDEESDEEPGETPWASDASSHAPRAGTGSPRQLSTWGCARHGHPEFVLEYAFESTDTDANWLRGFLELAVARGERFRAGETFQIGWGITRLVALADGRLTLHEPDFETTPTRFVPGVTRTLQHLRLQKEVADSVGLLDALDFPSPGLAVLVCTRLPSAGLLWMDRTDPAEGEESGWFIGCSGEDHDHQTRSSLARKTLYQVALEQPSVIPFLALPHKTQLIVPGRSRLGAEGLPAVLDRVELWHDEVPLRFRPGSLLDVAQRRQKTRSG